MQIAQLKIYENGQFDVIYFLNMAELHLEDAFRHKLIKFIPYTELENLARVDSGKFGSIHTAYWQKLRKTVAVKRLHIFEQNDTAIKTFVHEVRISALIHSSFNSAIFIIFYRY